MSEPELPCSARGCAAARRQSSQRRARASCDCPVAAGGVRSRLLEEDGKLPRRATSDRRVRWTTASYKAIHDILTNPVFAGAYEYGRKRTERRVTDVGVHGVSGGGVGLLL
jgi:Recombinase